VEDHCAALLAVLERGRAGEIYNIGADNEHTNLALAQKIVELLGQDQSLIQFVRDRPAHDKRYAMIWSKMRDELGWRPRQSAWPRALEETVRWYIENPAWWQQINRRQ
jgi:dTDP-glucose 4,6-dehydratase